jgi:hypothetical protein
LIGPPATGGPFLFVEPYVTAPPGFQYRFLSSGGATYDAAAGGDHLCNS